MPETHRQGGEVVNTNVTPLIGRHTRIIREVAEAHRVRVEDIMGPRRFRAYNLARREAMRRIRFELGFSYPRSVVTLSPG